MEVNKNVRAFNRRLNLKNVDFRCYVRFGLKVLEFKVNSKILLFAEIKVGFLKPIDNTCGACAKESSKRPIMWPKIPNLMSRTTHDHQNTDLLAKNSVRFIHVLNFVANLTIAEDSRHMPSLTSFSDS